jgi:hypothetical protein
MARQGDISQEYSTDICIRNVVFSCDLTATQMNILQFINDRYIIECRIVLVTLDESKLVSFFV